jgi:hypothetical protein
LESSTSLRELEGKFSKSSFRRKQINKAMMPATQCLSSSETQKLSLNEFPASPLVFLFAPKDTTLEEMLWKFSKDQYKGENN